MEKALDENSAFKLKRKLLDDLKLAGGKIKVSKEGIVIEGVIKVGEDSFNEQILGQTCFG